MNSAATRLTTMQKAGIYAALALLSIPALLPLLWMVSTSFKSNVQIFASEGFSFRSLMPSPPVASNYPDALHNMPFLLPTASRIIVLDQGRVIAKGRPGEVVRDPAVIAAYLGREKVPA